MSPPTTAESTKRFLLLQGPVGTFFRGLQRALQAAGHSAYRIRFNGGDRIYSGNDDGTDFRGAAASWVDFLDAVIKRERSTDLVLFGDCRPLHRMAIEHARALGLHVHVFEEGYLRPGWITLEQDGVNGYSSLPLNAARFPQRSDEDAIVATASLVQMPFFRRASEDVLYTLVTALLSWRYRGYRTHKPWPPLAEYRAGARRFFGRAAQRRHAAAVARTMIEGSRRFFLFPLQLDSDAQIRVHSPFGRMRPAIETVIRSFAAQAPMDTQLVISEHPLDQAVVDLQPIVMQCAESLGVTRRIVYLHGGTPPPLLAACLGMVTVNSTMGLSALELGRPVAVLGQSVYRIPGLVHAGALDDFWTDARPPDVGLFQAFKHFLIQSTQLPGGYYGPVARRLAIAGAVRRLQAAREAAKDPDCIAAPAMNAMNPVVAITEGRAAFR